MPEPSGTKHKPIRIGLLGASLDTGNMGVSAIAESIMKIILNRWPDAEILFLRSGRVPQQQDLAIIGRQVSVTKLPIRFSKNIFLPYHFLSLAFYGLLVKVLPGSRAKDALLNRNPHFRALYEMDLAADITGGDSFSDIYGLGRFFLGFLCKWLVIFLGKKLVLLPQTYGPYRSSITKLMARYVLNHADLIYSRDQAGIEYVTNMLSKHAQDGKVRFAPDVAFVLPTMEVDSRQIAEIQQWQNENKTIVGLNISGFLWKGVYSQSNTLINKRYYQTLLVELINKLFMTSDVRVILVPHVFADYESDVKACNSLLSRLPETKRHKIKLIETAEDPKQIKYIIGHCQFLLGSRMHSCIAALSQAVPAVGLAYSDKFKGVFQTVNMEQCVADLRTNSKEQTLDICEKAFKKRGELRKNLMNVLSSVQAKVQEILVNL